METFAALMEAGRSILEGANQQQPAQIAIAEQSFRQAVDLKPHDADAMARLAHALICQGRWSDALTWCERALTADSSCTLARRWMNEARLELGLDLTYNQRLTVGRFPETIKSFSPLEDAIWRHVLSHIDRSKLRLTKQSHVITFGSCFAANLAAALTAEGIIARNLGMGEFYNSTFSNVELVEWLFGERQDASDPILTHFGDGRDEIASWLRNATAVVYTLGVAASYFNSASGAFVLPNRIEGIRAALAGKYVFRTTSVDENRNNLLRLINVIRNHNPNCKFVFSLSPVPLHATLEHRSVIEADCLSKSILRVAVDQLLSIEPSGIYWPSFEIVRWVGSYLPGMYGEEDGSPHHVSERVVRAIVRCFVQAYAPSLGMIEACAVD